VDGVLKKPLLTRVRLLRLSTAQDAGMAACRRFAARVALPADGIVVKRVAREGVSYTLRLGPRTLFACDLADVRGDGRVQPCALAVGKLFSDGLHDPRMTLGCGFEREAPLAFGWVTPAREARWVAVRASSGDEVYPTARGLPVRIAMDEGVSVDEAGATVEIRELTSSGRVLLQRTVKMRVAG
jgi:hypothetical protein